MAKLKSTKVSDDTIYSCLQMLGRLWLHGRISFSAFVKRQSFRPIGGGTSEILKEILGK
jgi:hypothetical protein